MKRKKNKTLRRVLGFIALALVVAILAAMPLLASGRAPEEEYPLSILSARAERREVDRFLSGGGSLQQEEGKSVTVPTDVKLTEFLVKNGDTVHAGDPIARVDRVSVMSAIASTKEAMDDLAKELESARKDSTTETITAPGGLVKKIYAKSGDSAADVMLEHGALAVISLDSLMAVQVRVESTLAAGDKVDVSLAGKSVEGTVKQNQNGELTVTLPDEGYEEGQTAVLTAKDGTPLGEGPLFIHAPWHAVAYSGTVDLVLAKEGKTVYEGGTVLTLKDMGYSAEYRSLARQHREYEEQMFELFLLYQSLTLPAPCDGIVSGIDEDSAQLLRSGDGWEVTLLANAPTGDPDAQYVNFVGQVVSVGIDGKVVLRMNPQFLSVADYTNLSGIPTDTAAMTVEVETILGFSVYQWVGQGSAAPDTGDGQTPAPDGGTGGETPGQTPDAGEDAPGGENQEQPPEAGGSTPGQTPGTGEGGEGTGPNSGWVISGCVPGDILLFAGDPAGGVVWAIRMGSGSLPGGTGGAGGGGFGGLGGSMGGMGGMGGMVGETDQEEAYGTNEAEVAVVTPTETMTLDIVIDELDLHKVALGQQVTVTVDALVGATFEGTVTKIGQTGENSGGSSKFTVTVTLPREGDMLSGMNAAVTIPLGTEEGVAIPLAALYEDKNRTFVYTGLEEETGEPTAPVHVETGLSDGEYVLITGLEEGSAVYYGYYEALENNDLFAMPVPPG